MYNTPKYRFTIENVNYGVLQNEMNWRMRIWRILQFLDLTVEESTILDPQF